MGAGFPGFSMPDETVCLDYRAILRPVLDPRRRSQKYFQNHDGIASSPFAFWDHLHYRHASIFYLEPESISAKHPAAGKYISGVTVANMIRSSSSADISACLSAIQAASAA